MMLKRPFLLFILLLLPVAPALAQANSGAAQDSSPSTAPERAIGTVSGTVVNGSDGGAVPESGEPMLHIWDARFQEKGMEHGVLLADGVFRFEEVPFVPGWQYAVMLNYEGATYFSEPAAVTDGQAELALEIPIFEATTSTKAVSITRQHILFDAAAEGQLLVGEVYVLSNSSDRTIALPEGADLVAAPLAFTLPPGAENIGLENNDNGRFKPTADGFVDTAPLRPGEDTAEVVVRYTLSYDEALTYQFTAPWRVDELNVLLPASTGLALEGGGLQPLEARAMGSEDEITVFSHDGLAAGETLALRLSGDLVAPPPAAISPAPAAPPTRGGLLAPMAAALGGLLLALAVWLYRRQPRNRRVPTTLSTLVTEIAVLDEAHEAGQIDDTDYARRRSLLFAEAQQLLPEQ